MARDTIVPLQSILKPFHARDLIASSSHIIALELVYDKNEVSSQHVPDDVRAWGYEQLLSMLVYLEKKMDVVSLLRPYSRPLAVPNEWKTGNENQIGFAWVIGLTGALSKEEKITVRDITSRVLEHCEGLDLSAVLMTNLDKFGDACFPNWWRI